jgi:O-antigen/teichoic acid export membrane protein
MTAPAPGTAGVLARGLASAWFSAGVATACSLWLAPFALSRLDQAEYAIFLLGNDVLLWLTFLDLGLTGALTARLAPHGAGDSAERDRIASTGFAAQSFIAALTLVVGLALAWAFPFLFDVPAHHVTEVRWVLALLAMATALTAATKTYNAILIANRRLYLNHLTNTWSVLVRTILVAGGLWAGWGLPSLAYGTLAATVFTALQTRLLVRRHLPLVRLSWALADRETLRGISKLGIWVSLNGISVIALRTADRFVVAQMLSLSAVTPYALTGRVYEICQTNLSQITNTIWPILAELSSREDKDEARRVWRGSATLSTAVSVVLGLAVWSCNGVFMRSWVGSQHYGGIWLDALLMLNMALLVTISSFRSALTGASVVKPQACARMLEGIIFICLAIGAAPVLGLTGIALAKLAATITGCLWMPSRVASVLIMNSSEIWSHVLGRFLALLILCLPIAVAGRLYADAGDGFTRALFSAVAVGVVSGVCVLHLGIWGADRQFISQTLRRHRLGRFILKLRLAPR